MNEFDIQMAILGPEIQNRMQALFLNGQPNFSSTTLENTAVPSPESEKLYASIFRGIESLGYRALESNETKIPGMNLSTEDGALGVTITSRPKHPVKVREVVIAPGITIEAKVRAALHEFGHVASYAAGTVDGEAGQNPFEMFFLPPEAQSGTKAEIVAEMAALLLATELGIPDPVKWTATYFAIQQFQPEWVAKLKPAVLKTAAVMREALFPQELAEAA